MFPEWLLPMAATLTQERFTGPEWVFERKLDGIRMLAFKNGADVKLYSRNRLLQHYPAVAAAIANLPVRDVILDGLLGEGRHTGHACIQMPRRVPSTAFHGSRWAASGARPSFVIRYYLRLRPLSDAAHVAAT